ncbi:MAG: PilZ domain-containing protein, partial [Sphingomonas sp.]
MAGSVECELRDLTQAESVIDPERRQDPRQIALHLVAKLHTANGEALCLVRNISPGGITAHVYSPLDIGGAVVLEFISGALVGASVVWQRDNIAGMQFVDRVDIATVFGLR